MCLSLPHPTRGMPSGRSWLSSRAPDAFLQSFEEGILNPWKESKVPCAPVTTWCRSIPVDRHSSSEEEKKSPCPLLEIQTQALLDSERQAFSSSRPPAMSSFYPTRGSCSTVIGPENWVSDLYEDSTCVFIDAILDRVTLIEIVSLTIFRLKKKKKVR